MPEDGACCAPDAAPPAVCSVACRGAEHRAPHRSSQPRGVCASSQDTRVEAVRQSARASSLVPDVSGHTATAKGPRGCATAAADGLGWPLGLSGAGTIGTAPRRLAGVFAAQGAGHPAQDPRQRAQRCSLDQTQTHGLTVFRTQVSVASVCYGYTVALQGR